MTTRLSNALANPRLLGLQVSSHIRGRLRPGLPDSWLIGDVRFSPSELTRDPQIGGTLHAMYVGNYETPTRAALHRYLRRGGVFVDIGANIGYFTAVAANLVGRSGEVYAFEPVPRYADLIELVAVQNPELHINLNRFALGSATATGYIDVAGPRNIGWNSMVPGVVDRAYHADGTTTEKGHKLYEQLAVPVRRFDEYANERDLHRISLVKLDVEGWEMQVLTGMGDLSRYGNPPVICEVSPHLLEETNTNAHDVLYWLRDQNYAPFDLVRQKPVSIRDIFETRQQTNVLFRSA